MSSYLLKFLKKENYINDLLDGKLYMNTLKYFKEKEYLDKARADKFETIFSHKQQKFDFININGTYFTNTQIQKGSITSISQRFDLCNIFCLFALWKEKEDDKIFIDEKNKTFGKYCICITDVQEFLNRVIKVIEKENIECSFMKVNYINKDEDYKIDIDEVPFTKFDNFKYQNEFRIAIDTKKNINKSYILEIGDIRDIAFSTSIDELNQSLLK